MTKHGTASCYVHLKCRCVECTEANTRRGRRQRQARLRMPVPAHLHGTENAYDNYGCRCAACKAAGSEKNRRYRLARQAAAS